MHTLTAYINAAAIITPHGTGLDWQNPTPTPTPTRNPIDPSILTQERVGVGVGVGVGKQPPLTTITNPATGRRHLIATVPPEVTAHLTREPRLRRASPISHLAVAAAQAAITASGITPGPNTALILAVSSGCAQYTRRFYHQIITTGANTASPLLFPETVHNAPASHLAAILRLDGPTYTLIGDTTIGLQALHFANQLLHTHQATHTIIVAAEETDHILNEAHHLWKLTSPTGTCRPHRGGGTLLAEGAAAIILTLDGPIKVITSPGSTLPSRRHATQAMQQALSPYRHLTPAHIIDSANGTWTDAPQLLATAPTRHSPKQSIGEAIGAAALQQLALAAHHRNTLVTALGWNQHAAAAYVE